MTSVQQAVEAQGSTSTVNIDAVDVQQRLHDAHRTIASLHAEADAQAQHSYEVAEHLRQQLAAKNQQLMHLEMRLTQLEVQHAGQLQALEEAHTAREEATHKALSTAMQQHEDEASSLRTHLQASSLRTQLHELRTFAEEREAVHAHIQALEHKCVTLQAALKEQEHSLEAARLAGEAELRRTFEDHLTAVRVQADASLMQRLDVSVRRIFRDSEALKAEVTLHVQATAQLQKELQEAAHAKSQLRRDNELASQREEEYATRTAELAQQLTTSKAHIESLEKSLTNLVDEFQQQQRATEAQAAAKLDAAHRQGDSLRRLAQLQVKQLMQARRVARRLLTGRTNVELFLHTCIHCVQQQQQQQQQEVQGVKENGVHNGNGHAGGGVARLASGGITPRGGATPRGGGGATPRGGGGGTPRGGGGGTPRGGGGGGGTPRGTRTPRSTKSSSGGCGGNDGVCVVGVQTPRGTPRGGTPSMATPRGGTPQVSRQSGMGGATQEGVGVVEDLCAGQQDVRALSWAQREQVLHLLFAHIRGLVWLPALEQTPAIDPVNPPVNAPVNEPVNPCSDPPVNDVSTTAEGAEPVHVSLPCPSPPRVENAEHGATPAAVHVDVPFAGGGLAELC